MKSVNISKQKKELKNLRLNVNFFRSTVVRKEAQRPLVDENTLWFNA